MSTNFTSVIQSDHLQNFKLPEPRVSKYATHIPYQTNSTWPPLASMPAVPRPSRPSSTCGNVSIALVLQSIYL